MGKRDTQSAVVAVAAAIALAWAWPARAVDDLALTVAGGGTMVQPGDIVFVTLDVGSLSSAINGAQALIGYDPAILSLTDIVPTDLGLTPPAQGWVEVAQSDTSGAVVYAAVIHDGGISSDHAIATLIFNVIGEGSGNVFFRPDSPPFATKLTVAADNSTIFPNRIPSEVIVSTCDDGLFCTGMESFDGFLCQPGTDPCTPLPCDEGTDTCILPPAIDALEVFYAGRFNNQADPSRVALAAGGTSDSANVTNYIHGITGIRVFFDGVVSFATTPQAAFQFDWTTGTGTTFSPVTDAGTAITVTDAVQGSATVVTIVLADAHVVRRWLRVTVHASQITEGGQALDGELSGNPPVLPSGDGLPGGNAVFYLGNLSGDVDGDRRTVLGDVGLVRAAVNPFVNIPITNVFDVDKSGKVLLTDAGETRADVNPFFTLPVISP
jgi:hypothetical protein